MARHAWLIEAMHTEQVEKGSKLVEQGSRLPQQLQLIRLKLAIVPYKCQT